MDHAQLDVRLRKVTLTRFNESLASSVLTSPHCSIAENKNHIGRLSPLKKPGYFHFLTQ